MAVTSVQILHNGWSGSETAGAGITFNVIYQVEVDDRNDGPLVVLNADDGTTRVPTLGDSYAVGNDVDPFAFVKSVSPSPVAEKVWNVTVTFGPLEPGESPDGPQGQEPTGLDKNDNPTDDPTEEQPIVRISSVAAKRAALKAAYIGKLVYLREDPNPDKEPFAQEGFKPGSPEPQLNAIGADGKIKNGMPIVNSVWTPYDPPPEVDYNRTMINFSFNAKNPPPANFFGWLNTVNSEPVSFFAPGFARALVVCPAYTCRVMSISHERRLKNGIPFYSIDIEFLCDFLFTWRPDILDRGYCEDSNKLVSEGATAKNNIADESGLPLAEPVLLDGAGGQLDTEFFDAVYLRYAVYPEDDFNNAFLTDAEQLQMRFNN